MKRVYNPKGVTTDHALLVTKMASYISIAANVSAKSILFDKEIRRLKAFSSINKDSRIDIRAGLETLLQAYGVGYDEVGALYLAGGFGLKINLNKACGIGLLLGELLERTVSVGNTSIKGAVLFAFDDGIRDRFIKVASSSEEVSLADSSIFQEEYIGRMYFKKEKI